MEGHRFRDHSVWVWVAGALLLVLLVAGVVGAKPAWRRVKERRAAGFLERYERQRRAGQMEAAGADLKSAFFLAPDSVPVRRAVAHYYTRVRSPDGLALWRGLEAEGQLTAEDRLAYANLAVALQRNEVAGRLVKELMAANPGDPAVLALASELARRGGDATAALGFADQALTRAPADVGNVLRLAQLELRSSSDSIRRAGVERLIALVSGSQRERIAALSLLLTSRQLEAGDVDLLLRLVPERKDAGLEERLVRLELLNLDDPAGRSLRTTALARPLWRRENQGQLVVAASWLGAQGAYEDLVAMVPEDQAVQDERLFRSRAGALAELERWSDIESLLQREGAPAPPMVKAVLQATGSHAAGRTNESVVYWRQALALGQDDPGMLPAVARLAEARGYLAVASEAWKSLLAEPQTAARAASEILRLAALTRDLGASRDALHRLDQLGLLPPEELPGLAFADLLLLGNPVRAERILAAQTPGATPIELVSVTAALLALRQNQPEQAARALEKVTLDWTTAPESWRAVRIAELGANGRRTEARDLAASLNRAVLQPAERSLVDPWMAPAPK